MPKMLFARPARLIGMSLLAGSFAACSTVPTATGCSELARSILTNPVAHAEMGNTGDAALDWQLYGIAETGQLNTANDRAQTGYNIIRQCEVRDEEIRRKSRRITFL